MHKNSFNSVSLIANAFSKSKTNNIDTLMQNMQKNPIISPEGKISG